MSGVIPKVPDIDPFQGREEVIWIGAARRAMPRGFPGHRSSVAATPDDPIRPTEGRPLVAAIATHENYENVRGLALDDPHYDPIPPTLGTAVQEFIVAAVEAAPTALRAAIYGFSSAMRPVTFL